jgi:hypothetical protein
MQVLVGPATRNTEGEFLYFGLQLNESREILMVKDHSESSGDRSDQPLP